MNKAPTLTFTGLLRNPIRTFFLGAVLLGLTSLAVAHHGNPQAPTTPPWYESPLPGQVSHSNQLP